MLFQRNKCFKWFYLRLRPPSYRILHQAEGSEVYLLVSECMQLQEALADWQWLEKEVLPGLGAFDDPAECVEYVAVKVSFILFICKVFRIFNFT